MIPLDLTQAWDRLDAAIRRMLAARPPEASAAAAALEAARHAYGEALRRAGGPPDPASEDAPASGEVADYLRRVIDGDGPAARIGR